MQTRGFSVLRVSTTAVVAGVAVVVAIIFWNYYMRSPWTRDGRARVEVVNIASEVAGKILAVPVVDNQMVQKGDVLFLGPIGVMLCFPKTMAFANVFPLVFLTEVAPTNLMTFNLTDFLNVAFAATSGVFVGAISYVAAF